MESEKFDLRVLDSFCDEPVFVKEALFTIKSSGTEELVGLDDCLAWLIVGRSAYVWKYAAHTSPTAHKIQLAASGLKYSALLLSTFQDKDGISGCVSVSPEGVVRYWRNVALAQHFTETSLDLNSQVAQSLKLIHSKSQEHTFLLATSTCNLFKVHLPTNTSQKLRVENCAQSSGVIGGIGRRMSSILFSITPNSQLDLRLVCCVRMRKSNICVVLSCRGAQAYDFQTNQVLWNTDMTNQLQLAATEGVWIEESRGSSKNQIGVDIIDGCAIGDNGLIVLVQTTNMRQLNRRRLFLAMIDRVDFMPSEPKWIMPLSLEMGEIGRAHMYPLECCGRVGIVVVHAMSCEWYAIPDNPCDCVRPTITHSLGLKQNILGSGYVNGECLLFLHHSGLKKLNFLPKGFTESALSRAEEMVKDVGEEGDDEDYVATFKQAFILFAKTKSVVGRKTLLNVVNLLESKKKTVQLLCTFLTSNDLWTNLVEINVGGVVLSMNDCLQQLVDKLNAAVILHTHQNIHQLESIMSLVYNRCIEQRGTVIDPNLKPNDYFFTQISKLDDFVVNVVGVVSEEVESSDDRSQLVWLLCAVVQLILDLMAAAQCLVTNNNGYKACNKLIRVCVQCASELSSPAEQGRIADKITELSRVVLLHSQKCDKSSDYESLRYELVDNLVQMNQLERATQLAEIFADFAGLIRLTEIKYSHDQTTLTQIINQYKRRYNEFDQFVYQYYLDQGQPHKIVVDEEFDDPNLTNFLGQHQQLLWIHQIKKGNFDGAHRALYELARNEKNSLSAQKTLLSLSKLSAIVESKNDVIDVDPQLDLIDLQSKITDSMLQDRAYNTHNMPPLPIDQVLQIYYSENDFDDSWLHNVFSLLLHLARDNNMQHVTVSKIYANQPNKNILRDVRTKCWIHVLLSCDWENILESNNLQNAVTQSNLGRALAYLCKMDDELSGLLVPVSSEMLSCAQLSELINNKSFQYVLQAAEQNANQLIQHRLQSNMDDSMINQ